MKHCVMIGILVVVNVSLETLKDPDQNKDQSSSRT